MASAPQIFPNGRFVDVGANDPTVFSISKAFYDHGWRGISVEPSHHFAQLHRDQRPGDIVVEAAVASRGGGTVTLHEIDDSGLSTLRDEVRDRHASQGWKVREVEVPTKTLNEILDEAKWDGLDIHFMTVDVEGAEGDVLASIDLDRWRPWILVIESTEPLTTSPTHSEWEPQFFGPATSSASSTDFRVTTSLASTPNNSAMPCPTAPASSTTSRRYSQREVMGRLVTATGERSSLVRGR